jgi:hypothetical protein
VGLGEEVLDYMTEIAHAAIEASTDIVTGHGPHYSLPIEIYRGKPIFYGLGSFSFRTSHGGDSTATDRHDGPMRSDARRCCRRAFALCATTHATKQSSAPSPMRARRSTGSPTAALGRAHRNCR